MTTEFKVGIVVLIGILILFGLTQLCLADIIILKNGRRINGDIIGESPTTIVVKSVVGTTTVNRSLISQILKEEQEVNHVRNGDYYMDKGEYALATTEYAAALRLNPNMTEVEQKLADAKSKLAQTMIDRLAPLFAEGDRLLAKGFYDDAIKSYRDVARVHPEPDNITESNRKVDETCRALLNKGDEYASLKNYNSALEMYSKVTMYNSGELALQSSDKIKGLASTLFGEGDTYIASKDLVKASKSFEQIAASSPGDYVDSFIKDKMRELSVQLRYAPKVGDEWKYKLTQKSVIKIPTTGQNAALKNMNMDFDITGRITDKIEKVEGDQIDLVSSIDNMKASMNLAGVKQTMPIPNIQQKSFSSSISRIGKPIRNADLSSITGEGTMGTEAMYAGFGSGYITTLPQDTVRVGDKWVEPINQSMNLGSVGKMKMNGRIRYSLLGFENMAKYACAKIEGKYEDVKMTFEGNIKPTPDQPAQNMTMSMTLNGTGVIYFAYNEGKMVRNSNNFAMEMSITTFSGGGGGGGGNAPTPAPMINPEMGGPGGPETGRGRPPDFEGPRPNMNQPMNPEAGPSSSPLQQTGQMNITATVISDLVLTD
ncbi:MAG: tetratricopeptide repeat protein [bacterium]